MGVVFKCFLLKLLENVALEARAFDGVPYLAVPIDTLPIITILLECVCVSVCILDDAIAPHGLNEDLDVVCCFHVYIIPCLRLGCKPFLEFLYIGYPMLIEAPLITGV